MSKEYKPTEINYMSYLSSVIECEEKQDGSIQHEWTFIFKNDAIKVCNYLKGRGYKAYWKEFSLLGSIIYYVGVPFDTLRKTLVIVLLLISSIVHAQPFKYEQPKLKEYLPSLAFCFLSGMADGTRDASIFYHIKNGGYFDGRDSWKNKYKNGDYRQGAAYFGSTNVLAWTTDGVHLMSTVSHQADAWAMVMQPPDNNKRFGHLLLKVAAISVARSAGHFLMYDILIPNNNRQEGR